MNTADVASGVKPFNVCLSDAGGEYPLAAVAIDTLQVNLGYLCNQACGHCHLSAGPERKEVMPFEVMEECVKAAKMAAIGTIDITGGAPEMNPDYGRFVESAIREGLKVKTRTNLTILLEDGYKDLPAFFAANGVEVVASLPHYLEGPTDRMRGKGVFKASIEAIKTLNALGYGRAGMMPLTGGAGLILNLVHNPGGAYLCHSEKAMELDYRRELKNRYGIEFNNLFAITNFPVGRFLGFLAGSGNLAPYYDRLVSSYNPQAGLNAMCRKLISVGWDGSLYDCDFNQALGLKCRGAGNIRTFDPLILGKRTIVTGPHCYACAAGKGASCAGEVA